MRREASTRQDVRGVGRHPGGRLRCHRVTDAALPTVASMSSTSTPAGLMLVGPDGDLRVMASSSETMRLLELFELQSEEGPCLDCYRSGQPSRIEDLAAVDGRWPRFAAEALAAGFHSVHALPLRLRSAVIGALNLFHVEAGADATSRRRRRPSPCRRCHHRHPATPRRARSPCPQRSTQRCTQQSHRDRAGQRDRRRTRRPRHGTGVLDLAQPRSQPQPPVRRRRATSSAAASPCRRSISRPPRGMLDDLESRHVRSGMMAMSNSASRVGSATSSYLAIRPLTTTNAAGRSRSRRSQARASRSGDTWTGSPRSRERDRTTRRSARRERDVAALCDVTSPADAVIRQWGVGYTISAGAGRGAMSGASALCGVGLLEGWTHCGNWKKW